jgi:hypothetical protein
MKAALFLVSDGRMKIADVRAAVMAYRLVASDFARILLPLDEQVIRHTLR